MPNERHRPTKNGIAVGSVYLIVEEQPAYAKGNPFTGLLGTLAEKAMQEQHPYAVESDVLALAVARKLKRSGIDVAAFRSMKKGEPDPYKDIFKPAVILRLKPGLIEADSYKNTFGKIWSRDIRLPVSVEVEDAAKTSFSEIASISETSNKEPAVKDPSFGIDKDALADSAARQIAARFSSDSSDIQPPATWFSPRLAVLPFSDETTSVDAPIVLRKLAHRMLKDSGYSTIPLEEVDEILRGKGFSQGGQLKAAKPDQLAQWLKADRLLFGDVELFQSVPMPMVSGKLLLWDAREQKSIWSAKAGAAQKTGGRNGLSEFKRYSGESWLHSLWMPASASLRFSRRALRTLPQRVPEK